VNLILNYIVVLGWAGTWDQIFHNQVLYRRETDKKWTFHPWDADGLYARPVDSDLYAGDTSQPHLLRRAIIQNFKDELNQRYRLFQATVHSKASMQTAIRWANQRYDRQQALNEGYGRIQQNLDSCVNAISGFSNARWDFVNQRLGAYAGNAAQELRQVTCPSKPTVVIQYLNFSGLPGAPIDFQVIRRSSTSAELRWFPPNNFGKIIVAYIVRFGPAGEPLRSHPTRATVPVTEPMNQHSKQQGFVDENLAPGSYRYTVAAVYNGATAANFAPIVTVNLNDNNVNNNVNNVASRAIIGNELNYGQSPVQQTQAQNGSSLVIGVVVGVIVVFVIIVLALVIVPRVRAHHFETKEERA